jgi:hypothetical protein
MKRPFHLLTVIAAFVLAVAACSLPSCTGTPAGPFHWPDVARCGSDVGNLVGTVSQILLNDTGKEAPSPETKQKLEGLARQHGAATILCLVDQLSRDWTAVGASASPERFGAAMKGRVWLADTGTQIQRGD